MMYKNNLRSKEMQKQDLRQPGKEENYGMKHFEAQKHSLRQPGIEAGSAAWKATMLTITPLTLLNFSKFL